MTQMVVSLFVYMSPVLYGCEGVLADGKRLSGQYSWSMEVRLGKALLTCRPPSLGTLTLTLEVDGQLTPLRFVVSSSPQIEVTQEMDLGLAVPANTTVRWLAAFTEAPENAASYVSVAMQAARDTGIIKPALQVVWVNRAERVPVFNYDADTHQFNPTPYAASRASIQDTGSVQVALQGVATLVVSNGTIYAAELREAGTTSSESPRLEFQVGLQRVATLTKSGMLLVPYLAEGPCGQPPGPTVLTPAYTAFYNRFEFYSDGALTAVLSAAGLSATAIQEPLP
jgi:hypothetical protein